MTERSSTSRPFEGRVALVTGGAGGIGAATAERLAAQGATVVLADRDLAGAEAVAERLRAADAIALAVECDQTDAEQVRALFEDSELAGLGRLDACFANAGWGRVDAFLDLPVETWRTSMDVNLTGTFLMCQGAARRMIACGNGGAIAVTSSSGAIRPAAKFAAYCTAKAALNMLVQVMAYELGPHDIRVNAVMPGVTETSMTKVLLDSGARDQIEAETPLGRTGRPEDLAAAVTYLLGDDSSFVTGTSLLVDGGGTLGASWFASDFRERGQADWQLRHARWPVPPIEQGAADAVRG
jgi:NAD(P)-dependent dehydrogenase (short-subunit alcohol dehydrogenase family)